MLPPLADVTALGNYLGESIVREDPRALSLLNGASALVRAECARTFTVEGELADVPDEISIVVVQVAARRWQNPEGVVGITTGPFTDQLGPRAADGLYLSALERAVCARFRPTSGLWTQQTTRSADETELFMDVEGSEPIPWAWP